MQQMTSSITSNAIFQEVLNEWLRRTNKNLNTTKMIKMLSQQSQDIVLASEISMQVSIKITILKLKDISQFY